MLLRASHKAHTQLVGNQVVKIDRGDFIFGRLQWEKDLRIKGWKLQKATALMMQQSMIVPVSRNSKHTVFHINNYEKYQQQQQQQESEEECGVEDIPQQQHPLQSNSRATAEQQQSNTNNKGNKEKKVQETSIVDVDDFFENIWALYPLKLGKGAVKKPQRERLYKIGFDELSRCIERYRASKEDWRKWKDGSTFFNSGYVDYLDVNYKGAGPAEDGPDPEFMDDVLGVR
jgi:hypothetical protein